MAFYLHAQYASKDHSTSFLHRRATRSEVMSLRCFFIGGATSLWRHCTLPTSKRQLTTAFSSYQFTENVLQKTLEMAFRDSKLKKNFWGNMPQDPQPPLPSPPPPPPPTIMPPSALQTFFLTWRTLSKSYATHLQGATWRYSEGGRFVEVQLYLHIS